MYPGSGGTFARSTGMRPRSGGAFIAGNTEIAGTLKTTGRIWTTALGTAALPAVAVGVAGDAGLFQTNANLFNFVGTGSAIYLQGGFGACSLPTSTVSGTLDVTGRINGFTTREVASGVTGLIAPGGNAVLPVMARNADERLMMFAWVVENTAGVGFHPGAVIFGDDLYYGLRRTAVANQFDAYIVNSSGVNSYTVQWFVVGVVP